jgi:carbamoyl-phosphate synthase large subunit
VGESFGEAYAKAQEGAGTLLPVKGNAMLSVRTADRARLVRVARELLDLGFSLYGTRGTAARCARPGCPASGSTRSWRGGRTSWT